MFVEACLLRPSLDCFSASTPKKPAKRGPKPKQIGTSDYCRTCGCFVYLNSSGQSFRSHKSTENLFLRVFVKVLITKRKLAHGLRDLGFTVSQTEDQSSRVCLHCSNQARSTRAGFFFIKASFQESAHDDDSFRFLKKQIEYPHHLMVPRQGNAMTEMPASLITST